MSFVRDAGIIEIRLRRYLSTRLLVRLHVAEGLLYVVGCAGDGAEVGIGQVDVREVNDDVEGLQRACVAVQMPESLLRDGPNTFGVRCSATLRGKRWPLRRKDSFEYRAHPRFWNNEP